MPNLRVMTDVVFGDDNTVEFPLFENEDRRKLTDHGYFTLAPLIYTKVDGKMGLGYPALIDDPDSQPIKTEFSLNLGEPFTPFSPLVLECEVMKPENKYTIKGKILHIFAIESIISEEDGQLDLGKAFGTKYFVGVNEG